MINNQLGLVGVIDRDGVLLEVDDRSLSIAGLTRDDVIGRHFAECPWWTHDPAVAERMRESMRRALAGEVVRYDVPLYAQGEWDGGDGRLMIDFMIAPVFDDQGSVTHLIPSGVDISQRVKAEEAHRDAAARLETIFNTAIDGLITINPRGVINSVNQAALDIFGYRPEELVGKNVNLLMPEPYHSEHDGYLAAYRETGVRKIIGQKREVRGRRKNGKTFPLELAVSETFLSGAHAFVGSVRDITQRKLRGPRTAGERAPARHGPAGGGHGRLGMEPERQHLDRRAVRARSGSPRTARPTPRCSSSTSTRTISANSPGLAAKRSRVRSHYEIEFRVIRPGRRGPLDHGPGRGGAGRVGGGGAYLWPQLRLHREARRHRAPARGERRPSRPASPRASSWPT